MTIAAGYDAELQQYDEPLFRTCRIETADHVLDIGCGAGHTTRRAGRTAATGHALGVDVSAAAIDRARESARAEGLTNVTFECADAQAHPFPEEHFHLAISRFGTMFFPDPVTAFTNIAGALRPAGRLVMLVWQAADRNEWAAAIREALGGAGEPPTTADAFSLADPQEVTEILHAAGFTGVALTEVAEPVHYGPDVDAALTWVRGFAATRQTLDDLDPDGVARAEARLRRTLAAHQRRGGVRFDSRAWLVTAGRRPRQPPTTPTLIA